MTKTTWKKILSLVLSAVLIAAMALTGAGCGSKTSDYHTYTYADGETLGTGATTFTLVIADKEGKETKLTISTDKEMLGDALLELELIDGSESEYGLYVKQVNGITADYDTDGTYWAFYIGSDYAQTGVDVTPITAGAEYRLAVE